MWQSQSVCLIMESMVISYNTLNDAKNEDVRAFILPVGRTGGSERVVS